MESFIIVGAFPAVGGVTGKGQIDIVVQTSPPLSSELPGIFGLKINLLLLLLLYMQNKSELYTRITTREHHTLYFFIHFLFTKHIQLHSLSNIKVFLGFKIR